MITKDSAKKLCSKILMAYEISKNVNPAEVEGLKIYRSRLFGFCNVYKFQYKNRKYLVSDDYSLMDNPKYIYAVFEDATGLVGGKLIENPTPQSDGARYALGIDGDEYYLWESQPK